eukprot:Skav223370  [mRNA]  locus=scaffold1536:179632:180429:+ [translate_table: standard]
MSCGKCRLFDGNPCAVCRTLSRINFLVCGGRLLRVQETAVLQSLRDAAGALSDLAEQAGPILKAELATSDVLPEEPGAREEENPGGAASGSRGPTEEEVARERPGRSKRDEKETDSSPGEGKGTPKREKLRRLKKDKRKSEEKKATKRRRESPEAPERKEREAPEEGRTGAYRTADEEVAENPRRFGLDIIPRGSARSHFEGRHHGGDRPPPEPVLPPRGRESNRKGKGKKGGRERTRGTKGSNHQIRGWERAKRWQAAGKGRGR